MPRGDVRSLVVVVLPYGVRAFRNYLLGRTTGEIELQATVNMCVFSPYIYNVWRQQSLHFSRFSALTWSATRFVHVAYYTFQFIFRYNNHPGAHRRRQTPRLGLVIFEYLVNVHYTSCNSRTLLYAYDSTARSASKFWRRANSVSHQPAAVIFPPDATLLRRHGHLV